MGIALSVFKLIDPNKDELLKEGKIISPHQKTLADFHVIDELDSSKSSLSFLEYDKENERITYNAVHFTPTIKRTVRVFIKDIDESMINGEKGDFEDRFYKGIQMADEFQEVYKFIVIIDLKKERIFVFIKGIVASSFIYRFKKSKLFDYGKIVFDLTKIGNIADSANIWGAWETGKGRCTKKAYFGTEVDKLDELDKNRVTSYNIEFESEEGIVQLFISKDGRISTNSKTATEADLIRIYSTLEEELS